MKRIAASAATGHINPGKVAHSLHHPSGPDSGVLPNLDAAADGIAKAAFFTTRVCVARPTRSALLDQDRSTVVIHEDSDDHMTQRSAVRADGSAAESPRRSEVVRPVRSHGSSP